MKWNWVFLHLQETWRWASSRWMCTILIHCEDFGQGIPMPWYKFDLPWLDYFTLSSMLQDFMIADRISNVYLYDEHLMGKDEDALCNLRMMNHLDLLLRHTFESMSKVLIVIMDNCVGQNKSQLSWRFFSSRCLGFMIVSYLSIFFQFIRTWPQIVLCLGANAQVKSVTYILPGKFYHDSMNWKVWMQGTLIITPTVSLLFKVGWLSPQSIWPKYHQT